jgi:hypothetical protein
MVPTPTDEGRVYTEPTLRRAVRLFVWRRAMRPRGGLWLIAINAGGRLLTCLPAFGRTGKRHIVSRPKSDLSPLPRRPRCP